MPAEGLSIWLASDSRPSGDALLWRSTAWQRHELVRDLFTDAQGCRRRRGRGIEDMDHATFADDVKIIEQLPPVVNRLRAYAAPSRYQIVAPDFRYQALQALDEQGF